jgi:hypothetical protein
MEKDFLKFAIAFFFVLFVSVGTVPVEASTKGHSQPIPTPVSPDLVEKKIAEPYTSEDVSGSIPGLEKALPEKFLVEYAHTKIGYLGLNFYLNPKFSVSGVSLKKNDGVCAGSEIELSDDIMRGEFFEKGGPISSPPIEFVEDLDAVKKKIDQGDFTTGTYYARICVWAAVDCLRRYSVTPGHCEPAARCIVDGTVICSPNCTIKYSGVERISDNMFKAQKTDRVTFEFSCKPDCIFFVDRKAGEYEWAAMRERLKMRTSLLDLKKTLPMLMVI